MAPPSNQQAHIVAIVVDAEFGDRLIELRNRLPIWIADTAVNRAVAKRDWASQDPDHTRIGAITTFKIDSEATPESWCISILGVVASHHDHYSHPLGYSGLEIYGTEPSATLRAALAGYGLTDIVTVPGGFLASTSDGRPAKSPNTE